MQSSQRWRRQSVHRRQLFGSRTGSLQFAHRTPGGSSCDRRSPSGPGDRACFGWCLRCGGVGFRTSWRTRSQVEVLWLEEPSLGGTDAVALFLLGVASALGSRSSLYVKSGAGGRPGESPAMLDTLSGTFPKGAAGELPPEKTGPPGSFLGGGVMASGCRICAPDRAGNGGRSDQSTARLDALSGALGEGANPGRNSSPSS